MSVLSPATVAVVRSESRLFGRELLSLFWILVFPTLLLLLVGAVPPFREPDPALGGLRVIDLYLSVMVLLSMIVAAIMTMPPVIFAYRESGVLRRLATTPVRPQSVLTAQVVLHAAAVLVSSLLAIAAGALVFGIDLPRSLTGYAVAYVLALAATFSLGTVVTAVSPNARVGNVVGMLVFFPAMFTAGVYLPVQALPDPAREILALTPLTAAAEALAEATAGDFPDPLHLLVIAVWTLLLGTISVRHFRWE